jgi:hypothetical protein
MMIKFPLSRVRKMHCPLFSNDEDFCLLDNCRYYDTERQECVYSGSNDPVKEPSYGKAEKTAVLDDIKEKPVYTQEPGKTDASYGQDEDGVLRERSGKTDVSYSEEAEQVQTQSTGHAIELSAKELWDRLRSCKETVGVPDYDGIIGALIKIVNNTPGVHYLTTKSMDFWYSNISSLDAYSEKLEMKINEDLL